ncbi:hypothetical protein B0A50_08565 [Salinomyces thailandicus]|uniref:Uncharacterized protein n=1 Tax=Salinomyces thailandicus TaxID=706561 RepID=A0A4U0TJI8_9PEZI|nr:hypothetical protein B0A50_08565 [Salinomyces thailandica]
MHSFAVAILTSSIAASAYAGNAHHRHSELHGKRETSEYWPEPSANAAATQCGCTTYTTTFYGAPTLVDNWNYSNTSSSSSASASIPTATVQLNSTTTLLTTVTTLTTETVEAVAYATIAAKSTSQ